MRKPEQPDIVKIYSRGKLIYTLYVSHPAVQILKQPTTTTPIRRVRSVR